MFVRLPAFVLILVGLVAAGPAWGAVDKGKTEADFRRWLDTDIRLEARRAGISSRTLDQVLGSIRLDWSLPDLATTKIKTQQQSEFRSPAAYFKQSRLSSLASAGRKQLARWDRTLDTIEQRFGVPRRVIIAIWRGNPILGGQNCRTTPFAHWRPKPLSDGARQAFVRNFWRR